jgi:hypothetical protein
MQYEEQGRLTRPVERAPPPAAERGRPSPWRSGLGWLLSLTLVCEGAAAAGWGHGWGRGPARLGLLPEGSAAAAALTYLRSVLHIPLLALLALLLLAALNAACTGKAKRPLKLLSPAPKDQLKYARILSKAIQCKTVAPAEGENRPQFERLRTHLRASFPAVFERLEVHEINTHSLAIEWRGSDPGIKPWLLCAHQDVVPAANQTWAEGVDPFAGTIAEVYREGRHKLGQKLGQH